MSERTVKVKCGDKCIRMQLTLPQSFDDFKEILSRRLNLGTEQISVRAIVTGDETVYDVIDYDGLHDLWNELAELCISGGVVQNQIERFDPKIVEINGVQYRVDVPMPEDSPIVQGYIDQYHLDDFITQTKAMTAAVGLSYIATVASGDHKLISEINDICFSVGQMCCDSRLLMSGYERTSSHIIEKFQHMIMYLNQNHGKDAAKSFEKVYDFAEGSCTATRKLIGDFKKTQKKMLDFTKKIAGVGHEMQVKFAPVSVYQALIAAPIFLWAGVSTGFALSYDSFKGKTKALEGGPMSRKEIQTEIEARLAKPSLGVEPANDLICCLKVANRYINDMTSGLQRLQAGWEELEITCKSIAKNDEQIMQHLREEKFSKALAVNAFKCQVVQYYARWVALKAFAKRCNESLKAEAEMLEDGTKVDMTREEAKEYLKKAAEDKELICLMAPEQCKADRDKKTE